MNYEVWILTLQFHAESLAAKHYRASDGSEISSHSSSKIMSARKRHSLVTVSLGNPDCTGMPCTAFVMLTAKPWIDFGHGKKDYRGHDHIHVCVGYAILLSALHTSNESKALIPLNTINLCLLMCFSLLTLKLQGYCRLSIVLRKYFYYHNSY